MNPVKTTPEIVGGDTEQGAEKSRWWFVLVITTVSLALLSALATFVVLAGIIPIVVTREVVNSLFITNGVLIFILIFFVIGEGVRLLRARRSGQAASDGVGASERSGRLCLSEITEGAADSRAERVEISESAVAGIDRAARERRTGTGF